ncbi:MAG: Rpp14/Pop5 family protein [Thermoplasmatota archaeon]
MTIFWSVWSVDTIIKEGRRHRYTGFVLEKTTINPNKNDFMQALQQNCQHIYHMNWRTMGIKLIHFNGKAGIIKYPYDKKEKIIYLLSSIHQIGRQQSKISTIATSGTIRSLLKKHPSLSTSR